MQRSTKIALAALAVLLAASVGVRVAVVAQGPPGGGGRGGAETPDNAKTIPVTVVTREYDKQALLSAPPLSPEAYTGRVLWLQRCAYCHDGVGQPSYKTMGPWLGAETVQAMGGDVLKAIIQSGTQNMPAFKYDLDAQQLDDVIEFLKTVPSSDKPTATQLAGRAAAAGGSD